MLNPAIIEAGETLVPFAEGHCRLVGNPSRHKLRNWAEHGCLCRDTERRVYLEYCYVGNTPHTSVEAYNRFLLALNGKDPT